MTDGVIETEPGTQLQMFDADQIRPSYEAKRILLSQQVDYSHISGGQFCWPFTIASPTASTSSSSTSSVSSLGNTSPNSYSTRSDIHFQLIVTIYRRGRLNRNIGFVITISCHERPLTLVLELGKKYLTFPLQIPPCSLCSLHPNLSQSIFRLIHLRSYHGQSNIFHPYA